MGRSANTHRPNLVAYCNFVKVLVAKLYKLAKIQTWMQFPLRICHKPPEWYLG